MITIDNIKQGIAKNIAKAYSDLPITDEPQRHVEGAAFFVKMTSYNPSVFHKTQARRIYQFDVVYFAPINTPRYEIDSVGQRVAEEFMRPISFDGRHIYAKDLYTRLIDDDFHIIFNVDFFDEIKDAVTYEFMEQLEFCVELKPKE